MPTILRIGRYVIFFWSNENEPVEPIHVHVALGHTQLNSTKLWITSMGKVMICNNASRINEKTLQKIIRAIESNVDEISSAWLERFGEIKYFC